MQIAGGAFVVTGGASGLGAACARRLLALGGRVVLADSNRVPGQALADELGAAARFACIDVSDTDSAREAFASASALGPLRGLINCAGIAPAERLLGRSGVHSLESFQAVIAVNLTGTFNMIRLAADAMQHQTPDAEGERGVIVNTGSIAACEGQVGQAAYAASKGGVAALTLPLARELARFGIRVLTIAPGLMETPLLQAVPAEARARLGAAVPFPTRLGRAGEFAQLVEHVIGNPYLNGAVIRLDGALRMAAQ